MKRYMVYAQLIVAGLFIASCSESGKQAESSGSTESSALTTQVAQAGSAAAVASGAVVDANGWYHDWDTGLAAAREQGRPILVDFYTDWCKWCKVMDEKTFSDPMIKKQFADGWITIKVDAEDSKKKGTFKDNALTYRELTSAFGVSGFPSYVFIDKNGEPVNIVSGYKEKEQFTVILDYFKDEIYKLDEEAQKKFIETRTNGAS